jgi:hypothetical protein
MRATALSPQECTSSERINSIALQKPKKQLLQQKTEMCPSRARSLRRWHRRAHALSPQMQSQREPEPQTQFYNSFRTHG